MPAIQQAAILCGGLGTRLGALTAALPKPLLPVGERPFLDILLETLGQAGVRRLLLLAGFMAERIADYAAATPVKPRFGLSIEVATEDVPLATWPRPSTPPRWGVLEPTDLPTIGHLRAWRLAVGEDAAGRFDAGVEASATR